MTAISAQSGLRPPVSRRRKRATAFIVGGVVLGMVGMSFAAVPLYRIFCQVTGYGGTTQTADTVNDVVLAREVYVQFDSNVAPGLGWDFRPEQRRVKIHIGEPTEVAYLATNTTDHPITGQAIFNVTPETVGAFFVKVECFCFTEQTLQPGETVRMPVLFYVDPKLADREDLDYVDTITLSYTFNLVAGAQAEPATAGGDG